MTQPETERADVPLDIVGMVLDAGVDWDEVAELVTESYCALAPATIVEAVHRRTE